MSTDKYARWVTVQPHQRMAGDDLAAMPLGAMISVLVEGVARLNFVKSGKDKWAACTTGGVPSSLLLRWPIAQRELRDPS